MVFGNSFLVIQDRRRLLNRNGSSLLHSDDALGYFVINLRQRRQVDVDALPGRNRTRLFVDATDGDRRQENY